MLSVSEVKGLLKQGYNDEQIGNILGYSKYKIHRFRKANNIPNPRQYKNKQNIRDIKKYQKSCNTQVELANKLNLSKSRMSEILSENEIEFIRRTPRLRIRKFGTWTIIERLDGDMYKCKCDCGNIIELSKIQITSNSNKCQRCKMTLSIREREKLFLGDFRRSEKVKKKELQKRGKSYEIKDIKKIEQLGTETYVNLLCKNGHMTKNKFSRYDGCPICTP